MKKPEKEQTKETETHEFNYDYDEIPKHARTPSDENLPDPSEFLTTEETDLPEIKKIFKEQLKELEKIAEIPKNILRTNEETKKNTNKRDEKSYTTENHCSQILKGFILPGLPHPLLKPEGRASWKKLRQAYDRVSREVRDLNPDLILIYSTYWASVLGHQIQAHPKPRWILVDDEWHSLGSIPYEFQTDVDFAKAYNRANKKRGLESRLTDYEGFPVDTGSVVCLKLIDPDNQFKSCIVSSNIYSDRAEQIILGKGARDALKEQNKKTVVFAITSLSNRYTLIDPEKCPDEISSKKDEEWNQKFLEFFRRGRLEDVSQLSRQFHREARVTKKVVNYKPFWWLASVMGETNAYVGEVYEYQPVQGTGAAIIGLTPTSQPASDLEFDEDNVEIYTGDRHVLSGYLSEKGKTNLTSEKSTPPNHSSEGNEKTKPPVHEVPSQEHSENESEIKLPVGERSFLENGSGSPAPGEITGKDQDSDSGEST